MTDDTEKFVTPCDLPNARQRELLTLLIEECSEVQKRATKALRFGLDEIQPGQTLKNSERLGYEVGDVEEVLRLMISESLLDRMDIIAGQHGKQVQLEKYLQTEAADA